MPSSVEYSQHRSHSPFGDALAQILEEGSVQEGSTRDGSIPSTDLGTRTRSARTGDSRRSKGTKSQITESVRTEESVLATDVSGDTGSKTTSTTVEKHHSSRRKGNRHVIHEEIITHETRGSAQPTARHHTIIITDPNATARREKRRAEREAQQARRAERDLRREQRQERRERHEARKAHSRDIERLIAAFQQRSHSRTRTSSGRSPITPTTRSGGGLEEELEQLKLMLAKSDQESENLRNKVRELTERLDLESSRASTAESQYKEYQQRLRSAEVARKKAEADAVRESEESARLRIIYETARTQQEDIQRELDSLQEERDEAEQLAADARTKARKFQEQLLVAQALEAGRKEGRREARRERKSRHREKEKVVERIIERVQPEEPTPRIVTESVVYEEEEGTESRRTTPRAATPELPQRDPSPIPPPPPPIIPPQHSGHTEPFPDLPDPPRDIQMPEVVDPAPLPPAPGGSAWSNWKNKIGGKLKRSNSRSETFSQDSYLDDPGMYGAGRPTYAPSERDNRSQYSHDRDNPSRSQFASPDSEARSRAQYHPPPERVPSRSHHAPPERDIPSRSRYTTRDRSPSPDYHIPPPPPPIVPMTGMTGMAGVGSMAGMSGMTGLTTLVPGPGSGPGAGPGAGPSAGPSTLHMPPPPQEMKASRKSSRAAKSAIPPPQPVFPPPPPAAEAPIHPIPYNNGLASPWHHKPAPILPEGWIPDADDDGHIDLPPAHEIHPSPLLMNNDLGERSAHPVVPSAPLPKTPKHRAGSHPTAPYAPMVFADDGNAPMPKTPKHYAGAPPVLPNGPRIFHHGEEQHEDEGDYEYEYEYEDDESLDIPIAGEPGFDPLAVRTPAHFGRPLSVIPELSPEYQPPPIPDAPIPSARQSTRSRYSQAPYRQEHDDHSATISVESGPDASVSVARKPSRWRKIFGSKLS